MKKLILAGMIAALTGCGGGGDDTSAAPAAPASNASAIAGLYSGTVDFGGLDEDSVGLVLNNGEYWFAYGDDTQGVAGFVQGTLQATGGNITSSDLRDFLILDDVYSATLAGTYVAGTSMNLTITYPGTPAFTAPVSLSYDTTGSAIPTSAAAAGSYTGNAEGTFGESGVDLTVSSTGAISGEDDTGCTFTGQLTPVKGGYTLSVSFGGGTCYFPGQTLTGVALHEGDDKILIGAVKNAARTEGLVFDVGIPTPPPI